MTDQLKESLRNAERRGGKASVARQIENWIADYHALEGVPDEFIDSDGVARQHWVRFFVALALQASARSPSASRPPIVSCARPRHLSRLWRNERKIVAARTSSPADRRRGMAHDRKGVMQRAPECGSASCRTCMAKGRLVADGAAGLPRCSVLAISCGRSTASPPGGKWLRFLPPRTSSAVRMGAGGFSAIARRRHPAGGHALENRVVFSRLRQSLSRSQCRPACWFLPEYREGLAAAAQRGEPRICLLTPGPCSQTYYG